MAAPLHAFDDEWRGRGFTIIAGVDEAGVGPWAGPVVAAAVILPPSLVIARLNDSKKLSPSARETLFPHIIASATAWAVGLCEPAEIDQLNILRASHLAARRALEGLGAKPDLVLFDGNRAMTGCPFPLRPIVKGDGKSASIAAASILAKVTRDRLMKEAHDLYPAYGFDGHKGYGTPVHLEALRRHGPCPLHRRSFAPVREVCVPQGGLAIAS